MFVPILANPAAIEGMTEKQLNERVECMCDNMVQLKKIMAVWTHKHGQTDYSWFPVCNFQCYTKHVVEGNS